MKALIALISVVGVMSSACFLHVSHYTNPNGSIVYVGEFYNDVPGPGFPTAEVQGTFYDATGNVITTKSGFTCNGVGPKGVIPFRVTLPPGTAEPARVDWRIVDAPAEPYLATGLEATVTNTFEAGSQTYVVGELQNTSTNTYTLGWPCAAWTDASGNVVRVTQGRVAGARLGPGDRRPFELSVDTPPAGSAIHFYPDAGVSVPGHRTTAIDVPTSALQHRYDITFPSGGAVLTYGVTEVHNSGSAPFVPEPIAEVRDASGKPLAVNSGDNQCGINVAPGSFSFATYDVTAPAGVTTPPDVSIQGHRYDDISVYFPSVSGLSFQSAGMNVTASGTVRNTTSVTLKSVRVCVGSYSAAGIVQGVGMTSVTLPAAGLTPGATASFTVKFGDPFAVASVKAAADGFDQTQ